MVKSKDKLKQYLCLPLFSQAQLDFFILNSSTALSHVQYRGIGNVICGPSMTDILYLTFFTLFSCLSISHAYGLQPFRTNLLCSSFSKDCNSSVIHPPASMWSPSQSAELPVSLWSPPGTARESLLWHLEKLLPFLFLFPQCSQGSIYNFLIQLLFLWYWKESKFIFEKFAVRNILQKNAWPMFNSSKFCSFM